MAHGGMIAAAHALFPDAPLPFVDLSTGINPVAYKLAPLPPDAFTRLPDAEDEAALRRVAASAYGVADPGMVVAAPGTQILISLLPHLLPERGRRVAILSPTYGEHEAAWRAAGYDVTTTSDPADLAGFDIAVLCNPNNPDGRVIDPASLLPHSGLLIVDEAFADLEATGSSAAGLLPRGDLLVLRSFGKWTGLAGVRLGFALAEPSLAARLRAALGPWAVSGPALAAGRQALADTAWRATTIARLKRDCARLDDLLHRAGMKLIGGTRLFRLYEGEADEMFHRLGRAGILVRRFGFQPRLLRFGLPGSADDWQRLQAALGDIR
jgi:cobalamin biosynthetic protein CobC